MNHLHWPQYAESALCRVNAAAKARLARGELTLLPRMLHTWLGHRAEAAHPRHRDPRPPAAALVGVIGLLADRGTSTWRPPSGDLGGEHVECGERRGLAPVPGCRDLRLLRCDAVALSQGG